MSRTGCIRWRRTLFACVAALLADPSNASADDPGLVTFRLRYAAPAGCPERDAFVRQVLARTSRARLADDQERGRVFDVSISTRGSTSRGTLRIHGGDQSGSERTIAGAQCKDVVSALALVTALTLDPRARTAPLRDEETSEPPAIGNVTAAKPSETVGPPVSKAPNSVSTVPDAAPHLEPSPNPLPFPAQAPRRAQTGMNWAWDAGISLDGTRGVAPGWLFAPRIHLALAFSSRAWFSPEFQLSAVSGTRAFEHELANVAMTWRTIRLESCPVQLRLAERFSARPCAFFDGGQLAGESSTSAVIRGGHAFRPWLGIGLLGRAVWKPITLISLRAQLGVTAPLVRDTFEFSSSSAGPAIPVHAVPALGAVAGIGLGLNF